MIENGAGIATLAKLIPEPDAGMLARARQRQAQLIKPPGALGRLETLAIQIASHCSAEAGHRHVLASLKLEPLLNLALRLGEASGAALAMPIVVAALATHAEMSTFAEAGVDVALESIPNPDV